MGRETLLLTKKSKRSSKKQPGQALSQCKTSLLQLQATFYSLNLALLLFPYGSPRGYGFLILCIDLMSELFSGYIICLCTAWRTFVMISGFMPCQSASPHPGSHTVYHLKSPNEVFWLNKNLYSQGENPPCKSSLSLTFSFAINIAASELFTGEQVQWRRGTARSEGININEK